MLNYINLVGKIVKEIHIEKIENGSTKGIITIEVPRNFKNIDGVYESDVIDCTCYEQIAINIQKYCEIGDVICVKGRIQSKTINNENKLEIIAEKVTFTSIKKEK